MHYVALATLVTFSSTGCSHKYSPSSIQQQKPTRANIANFKKTMTKVARSTQHDGRYNRMDLNTPEKKVWFKALMFKLWNRDITRKEFLAEGHKRYPKRSYEFYFIAKGFQKYS